MGLPAKEELRCPILKRKARDVSEVFDVICNQNGIRTDRMSGDHAIEIPTFDPAAFGDNASVGFGSGSIKRQNRDTAQQYFKANLPLCR